MPPRPNQRPPRPAGRMNEREQRYNQQQQQPQTPPAWLRPPKRQQPERKGNQGTGLPEFNMETPFSPILGSGAPPTQNMSGPPVPYWALANPQPKNTVPAWLQSGPTYVPPGGAPGQPYRPPTTTSPAIAPPASTGYQTPSWFGTTPGSPIPGAPLQYWQYQNLYRQFPTVPPLTKQPPAPTGGGFGTNYPRYRRGSGGSGGGGGFDYGGGSNYRAPNWFMNLNSWNFNE